MTSEAGKVLIIGAGLGGLALGQILKVNGIPFEIFERDEGFHVRSQGWAIALNECLDQLTKLLPSTLGDIYSNSVNAKTGHLDKAVVFNATTGDPVAHIGGVPKGQPGHILRCRREDLRKYLAQNLPVSTGKHFIQYTEDPEGVTVFFKDGSSARGSILIGADGASSPVRAQLLNDTGKATTAPFVPIMGTCTLPREKFEHLHDLASAGLITGGPTLRYLIATLSVEADRSSADYYYAACYRPSDAEAESVWTQSASKMELYNKATELTQDLPQFLTDIIHFAGAEGVVTPPLKFLEFIPPDSLPWGRVTLVGDAAHTMMPFAGAGANTALLDVTDLASMLLKSRELTDVGDVTSLLQRYSRRVCLRGKDNVMGSRASAENMNRVLGVDKLSTLKPKVLFKV